MTIDELFDEFRKQDLESFPKLSPIEYARLRGVAPQLVYYYIRTGKLGSGPCESCGRRVVDTTEADTVVPKKKGTRA